jgi:acyl homoserine lactone synthase
MLQNAMNLDRRPQRLQIADLRRCNAAKVFKDRLGWKCRRAGWTDGYDACDAYYMMIRSWRRRARLLAAAADRRPVHARIHRRTAARRPAPQHPRSEPVRDPDRPRLRFGFSEITMESFGEMIHYGRAHGIDRFVTVTTTAFERLLRRAGVVTTRLGEPEQIGIEKAVALYVEVEATYHAVYKPRLAS